MNSVNICTLNVRTLASEEKQIELENALNKINWDIIGISETRLMGEKILQKKNGDLFCYKGETKGLYGVGFIIRKKWINNIKQVCLVNERIIVCEINIQKTSVVIIQTYAPTSDAKIEIIDSFYNDLTQTLNKFKNKITYVIGDFNAKVGVKQVGEEDLMGDFGYGQRNQSGERLITWLWQNGLCVGNSFFKKRKNRKWTWASPNNLTKNEIDFVLTNRRKTLQDVSVLNKFDYDSDHRILRAKITINHRTRDLHTESQKLDIPKYVTDEDQQLFKDILRSHCNITAINTIETLQAKYDKFEKCIREAATRTILKPVRRKVDKLSNVTKELIKKREEIRGKENLTITDKYQLKQLRKAIKKSQKADIKKYDENMIKEILENTKSIKKVKEYFSNGREWIIDVDKNNKKICNRQSINETATAFFEHIYKSQLNDEQPLQLHTLLDESDTFLPFLPSEIETSLDELKNGKSFGNDQIKAEMLKMGKDEIVESLTYLFNEVMRSETIPTQWTSSSIILIHKKGDKSNLNNYRPISILSTIYKVFAKCLLRRMKVILDEQQPREQAGFRSGYSTMDHLHAINQVIEKTTEYQKDLCIAFIDFYKAFDSIEHKTIWETLLNQGLSHKIVNILIKLYQNCTAKIRTEFTGKSFRIERGVRQGDPLSPILFAAILEEIFRHLNFEEYGINIQGEMLNNLRFADDIALLAKSHNELQNMITLLEEGCKSVGLEINQAKTKIITNSHQYDTFASGEKIEFVEDYVYLGQIVSFKKRQEKEISRRITNGWRQLRNLKPIFESNISNKARQYLYNSAIIPVLTYGSQTWSLTASQKNKLEICERAMERSLLKVNRMSRITNTTLRQTTQFQDVAKTAKTLKWTWAGHIIRTEDNRWTKRTTEWLPRDGIRRVGRQQKRWRDELDNFKNRWEDFAKDRVIWKQLGEAYAQA